MFHLFHKWVPVKVTNGTATDRSAKFIDIDMGTVRKNATQILYKCSICGKIKTEEIWGHWSLEDIK